ncbi:MAG: hypothetical protein VXY04_09875, partial [Pseudomonadota bacterium]|nr:hypothetical protein [Pseudomonadota bacterium]
MEAAVLKTTIASAASIVVLASSCAEGVRPDRLDHHHVLHHGHSNLEHAPEINVQVRTLQERSGSGRRAGKASKAEAMSNTRFVAAPIRSCQPRYRAPSSAACARAEQSCCRIPEILFAH